MPIGDFNLQEVEQSILSAFAIGDLDRANELADGYIANTAVENEVRSVDSRWIRARQFGAQVALDAGTPRKTMARLSSILDIRESLPVATRTAILLMAAEASIRMGKRRCAAKYLSDVDATPIELAPEFEAQRLQITLKLEGVSQLAEELASCYPRLSHNRRAFIRLLTDEGDAWLRGGDEKRAVACFQRAVEESDASVSDAVRGYLFLRLGCVAELRGYLQEAMDYHDKAAELLVASTPAAMELQLRRIRLEVAYLDRRDQLRDRYLRIRKAVQGKDLPELNGILSTLDVAFGGPATPADEESFAWKSAAEGDFRSATTFYLKLLLDEDRPRQRARLLLSLGQLATALNEDKNANEYLQQAEQIARAEGLPEIRIRVMESKGDLYSKVLGDDDAAKRFYEQSLDLAEEQNLKNPVAQASYFARRLPATRHLLRSAAERGDASSFFEYQERERGRFLLNLWATRKEMRNRVAPDLPQRVSDINQQLDAQNDEGHIDPAARFALSRERDRILDEFLAENQFSLSAVPAVPPLEKLRRSLPTNAVFAAPTLVGNRIFLLVVRKNERPQVLSAPGWVSQGEMLISCVNQQLVAYRNFVPLEATRELLDEQLDSIGQSPLGDLLEEMLDPRRDERIIWIPDSEMSGLPIHAIRLNGRYMIETYEVCYAFSGAWLVHRANSRRLPRWGPSLIVFDDALPSATKEAQGVASSFFRSKLLSSDASLSAIRSRLKHAPYAHFACHAFFGHEFGADSNRESPNPLGAYVKLPNGEAWHAAQWIDEPLYDLKLMTLSACRSGRTDTVVGRELFGLVAAAFAAGVRNVVAALWDVIDEESAPIMWSLYRNRITRDSITALAEAQRAAIVRGNSSPLTWAAFAAFATDIKRRRAVWPMSTLRARRQRRHARLYP